MLPEKLQFKCKGCGYCCRHEPGLVLFSKDDLKAMAAQLSCTMDDFLKTYCQIVYRDNKQLYTIKEKKNNDCVFWEQGCTIYESRPYQCRSYPFWKDICTSEETWKAEKRYCPGIDDGPVWSSNKVLAILEKKENQDLYHVQDEIE